MLRSKSESEYERGINEGYARGFDDGYEAKSLEIQGDVMESLENLAKERGL